MDLLEQPLATAEFLVVDTETNGLGGDACELTEVGAVLVGGGYGTAPLIPLARALLAVGRPVLLILDNMQWCDQETLAFLTFCLGLAPGAQLLVAGTARDDNLGAEPVPADWTDRMRATGLLTELTLSPFEAADTARLAEAIAGEPLAGSEALLLQGAFVQPAHALALGFTFRFPTADSALGNLL